jgi:glucosamine--fructose-6-phosphate aminotransferase (isomerizing)
VAPGNGLCLAISQSGKSPDLLATVEHQRKAGAFVVAMVNAEDSPLAALADIVIPLKAGPERSVAATKSYICSLAAIAALVAAWAQDEVLETAVADLPAQLERAFALDWSAAVTALTGASGLFVLGRGYGYGIAQEAALKFKETCALHAESFSAADAVGTPVSVSMRYLA